MMQIAIQNSLGEITANNNLVLGQKDILLLHVHGEKMYEKLKKIGLDTVCSQFSNYIKNSNVLLIPPGMELKVLKVETSEGNM